MKITIPSLPEAGILGSFLTFIKKGRAPFFCIERCPVCKQQTGQKGYAGVYADDEITVFCWFCSKACLRKSKAKVLKKDFSENEDLLLTWQEGMDYLKRFL